MLLDDPRTAVALFFCCELLLPEVLAAEELLLLEDELRVTELLLPEDLLFDADEPLLCWLLEDELRVAVALFFC